MSVAETRQAGRAATDDWLEMIISTLTILIYGTMWKTGLDWSYGMTKGPFANKADVRPALHKTLARGAKQ